MLQPNPTDDTLSLANRAKALYLDGYSHSEIARILGDYSRSYVYYLLRTGDKPKREQRHLDRMLRRAVQRALPCIVCFGWNLRNYGLNTVFTCSPECSKVWNRKSRTWDLNMREYRRQQLAKYIWKRRRIPLKRGGPRTKDILSARRVLAGQPPRTRQDKAARERERRLDLLKSYREQASKLAEAGPDYHTRSAAQVDERA